MIRLAVMVIFTLSQPVFAQDIAGVARAGDGDSFTVSGRDIRLFGIDAPEYRQTCQINFTNWACGVDAAGALTNLINNQTVMCSARDTDVYGRTVATCLVNGRDVAAQMVTQGYAIVLDNGAADYARIEAVAKDAKVGIWASKFMSPADYRQANPRQPDAARPANLGRWSGPTQSQGQSRGYLYRTCAQARAAGAAPMRRGTAGYNPNLDGDNDGFACEPYYGRR